MGEREQLPPLGQGQLFVTGPDGYGDNFIPNPNILEPGDQFNRLRSELSQEENGEALVAMLEVNIEKIQAIVNWDRYIDDSLEINDSPENRMVERGIKNPWQHNVMIDGLLRATNAVKLRDDFLQNRTGARVYLGHIDSDDGQGDPVYFEEDADLTEPYRPSEGLNRVFSVITDYRAMKLLGAGSWDELQAIEPIRERANEEELIEAYSLDWHDILEYVNQRFKPNTGNSDQLTPELMTLDAYDSHSEEFASQIPKEVPYFIYDWLHAALQTMPKNARILEIGSGTGRDARYVQEQWGLEVECTDASQPLVDMMKKQGLNSRKLNVITDELGGPYDVILANAILQGLTIDELIPAMGKIYDSLKDGGTFAFTVKTGKGVRWDERLGAPRLEVLWEEDALQIIIEELMNFDSSYGGALEIYDDPDNPEWIGFIARKPDVNS